MIAVSNTLKQTCNSESLSYKEYIVIDGTTVEIKGKMSNTAYKNTTFFGTFNLKMLEFTTENDIDYKKKTFTYWKSVNGEAFKIGTYIVTDVNDNDSTEEVTVTAMDYGLKFATPYTSTLDYESGEITLYDVLTEACTQAGVTLKNVSIDNGTFIVDSNQFVNDELIGDVISAIAGVSGNFATITEDDKLELLFTTTTDEIIEDYVELDDKRDTQPITSVSLGTSQIEGQEAILRDLDLIAQYGEHWLIINDNLFAYTLEKRQQLVTAIFNKVKGFGYSSFVSKYSFKPYLQLGDLIQFKNKSGNLVNSIILKVDTDFDDITLSAPSITSATINYETAPSPTETAKRAEVIANQNTATITSVAEQTNKVQLGLIETNTNVDKNTNNINANSGDINKIDGTLTTTITEVAEIKASVDSITNTVKITGGTNMVNNSTMLFGTDGYEISGTGDIISGKITDLIGKTISESGFLISNKKVNHNKISGFVIGKEYTITFRYSNSATLKLVVNNLGDVEVLNTTSTENLKEFVYTFVAKSTDISYYFESTTDGDGLSLITDFIIRLGNIRSDWDSAKGETLSTVVSIYFNGIEVTSNDENIKVKINNTGFVILNTSTNTITTKYTKDGMLTKNVEITGKIIQGSFIVQTMIINEDSHYLIS